MYSLIDGEKVWELSATHGFPLEFTLADLAAHNKIPTWDRLILAAKKDGTNLIRFLPKLKDMITDAYPIEVSKIVCNKLDALVVE